MLACLQRLDRPARLQRPQRTLDTPLRHKSPSVAELDAFAQRTAARPLSIQISPASIRVPQHRTGIGWHSRFGPCPLPYAGGPQGLLAIVRPRGVLKSSGGRRARLSPVSGSPQMSRPSGPSPSCAESGFGAACSGAVLPTQSAGEAGSGPDHWRPELCYRSSPFPAGPFLAPDPPAGSSKGPGPLRLNARPHPPAPGRAPLLSCSLCSLESLVREIRPAPIRELMLGRGEAPDTPPLEPQPRSDRPDRSCDLWAGVKGRGHFGHFRWTEELY